jgi:Cysteine rich repeat
MLFGVAAAVAQTDNPAGGVGGGGRFRAACSEDLQRFCVGVQAGGGRLVQCLSSHTSELSAACSNVIAATGRGGAKLHEACDQDLQRFCVGVQSGGGRLVQCLSSHTSELSVACGNLIAERQTRRDTSNPSAQSPATQPAAPGTVGNSPVIMGSMLRASCGPDVQRLCAGARREGEVLKCLDSRRMELSTTCSLYFQKLGARPAAHDNAPVKKPPSPSTAPIPAQQNTPDKNLTSPPTTPIPAQQNAPDKNLASPPITPAPAQANPPDQKPPPPSTAPMPAQENAPDKNLASPPTAPIPAQENAPDKNPASPPTAPTPAQANAPDKKRSPPPAALIPN